MKVPFIDMKREADFLINHGIMDDIQKVISSGYYLFGPQSKGLEARLSKMFNASAVLVGSGTDALYLLLRAFDIGPGDRVALPAISAIPTAVAVKMTGAECVYVDVKHNTMTISLDELIKYENISAVIAVHLYGNIADVSEISHYCCKKNIPLVEDCAQSFGSKQYDKYIGTIGSGGAFSFYPTKNLGCFGDGGAVITQNSTLAEKIKELRFYGQREKYAMGDNYGMNSRMDEIQSAILLKKLDFFDEEKKKKLLILDKYTSGFSSLLSCQTLTWAFGSLPHLYPMFVKNRFHFMEYMKKNGIDTTIHYPFILPEAIDKEHKKYLIAKPRSNEVVSIPFNSWMTDEEVDYVINTIKRYKE